MSTLQKNTVEVTGTGQAFGSPDRVVLDLSIRVERPAVAAALEALQRAMSAVLAVVAESDRSAVAPRTQGMSVYPQHDSQGKRVTGYNAAQQLRLTFAGTDVAGESITALSAAAGDALGIDSVSLTVSDPAPLVEQAREAAFNDAQHRATQFARLADRSLGAVLAVCDAPMQAGLDPRMFRMAAADAAADMPIAPGEHTVTASVTVRWELV